MYVTKLTMTFLKETSSFYLYSSHYGVPQVRKRVILIGVRKDLDFKSKDVYDKIVFQNHYCPEMEKKGKNRRFN